jgi:hypothetical protein
MSLSPFSDLASSDLATLAELARDGSLDLTTVAFRVRTDLMVGLTAPTKGELASFMDFAAAALPKLQERDLAIVSQKLSGWPHTPAELKAALILRLPAAAALFEQQARERASKMATAGAATATSTNATPAIATPSPAASSIATSAASAPVAPGPVTPAPDTAPPVMSEMDALRAELLPAPVAVTPARPAFVVESRPVAPPSREETTGAANAGSPSAEPEFAGSPIAEPPLTVDARIDAARASLAAGDDAPARAILADASLGPQAQAAFFLIATPVQQSLMLSGLAHLERGQPRRMTGTRERMALERILDLAGQDRTGAFLALSDALGGTPEFAARITLDASRKLAGLCLIAIGGNDEDAVRFALRLADEPACDVATIFALADMARATQPQVAARMVRAIGGAQIQIAPRAGQHVPAADPSGTPQRQGGLAQGGSGQAAPGVADRRGLSPQEAARRLLAG